MKATNPIKVFTLKLFGMLFCILPPAVCILFYFPIWVAEGGEMIVSGFTLLLCALAAIPLYKWLRQALRSPSSYTMWLIAFLAFLLLSAIAEEMTVISFFGFIGNLIGALFFKAARKNAGGDGG